MAHREETIFAHSGYENIASHLRILLTTYPPSFIYLYDAESPRIASSTVRSVLSAISDEHSSLHLSYACVNAVACFTSRLFYDTVLNALAGWQPAWEDGCENWAGLEERHRWNENLDTFFHGLRAVEARMEAEARNSSASNSKGKGKARVERASDEETYRMVLVIERAERLRETLPDLLVPLTRLAELSQVDIVTLMISDVRWEDVRQQLGASPEPYYMDAPLLSKQATIDMLASFFPSTTTSDADPDPYHPAFRPLYTHYLATLYSICAPFTLDPHELAYIAAARWPGFVQPILDDYRHRVERYRARFNGNGDNNTASVNDDEDLYSEVENGPPELLPPAEDTRIRLTRLFTPSFTAALEALYPRLTNATDWACAHMPPPDLLLVPPAHVAHVLRSQASIDTEESDTRRVDTLPRMAKFVLVAAFLASTNPPKSDMRMFGRGPDERAKRRRRKGGSPRKPKPGAASGSVKIPQRLLGPTSFPLDRLLAILGVLLEENDAETRPPAPQYALPGEYTDMEISRVAVYAQVMELASMRLLLKTSPTDRLDTTPTFKCGISYEVTLRLAKDVGVL